MSFQLTAEQKELRDSVRGFLSEELSSEYLRKRIRDEHSTDIGLWKKLCDLGLFTYFAELPAEGGGSFSDLAMLAYEAGRSLLPETAVDAIFAGAYMKRLITAKSESSAVLAALDPSRERIATRSTA
jgi:alkylation response protein AidB-like acyl-CoA dehydrogenase